MQTTTARATSGARDGDTAFDLRQPARGGYREATVAPLGSTAEVHTNLPLSKLFTPPAFASSAERQFFYNANVDYTPTDFDGRPLLAIEFDGISEGYSASTGYISMRPASNDPRRAEKLNYKLSLARASAFPFYIVSFDEAMPRERLDGFTVLDDLIAQFLTKRREGELVQEYVDHLPDEADDDAVQDAVLVAGVTAELEMNPLERFNSVAVVDIPRQTGVRVRIVREEEFEEPPAPQPKDMFDVAALTARVESLVNAQMHGATVVGAIDGDGVKFVRTVRVRAVGHWFAVRSAAKRLAKYLVFRAIYDHLGITYVDPVTTE